jgi:hypothetical protein
MPYSRPKEIAELYEAIGSVVVAATTLERSLTDFVVELSTVPTTHILVRGERGQTLLAMAERLLKEVWGSSAQDQQSGRTARLGLISYEDTVRIGEMLKRAEVLFTARDRIVHSVWFREQDGRIMGSRQTRSSSSIVRSPGTVDECHRFGQDMHNLAIDLMTASANLNARRTGMQPVAERDPDVDAPF